MKRLSKNLLLSFVGFGLSLCTFDAAQACGRRGYSSTYYVRPVYSYPQVITRPVIIQQPTFVQTDAQTIVEPGLINRSPVTNPTFPQTPAATPPAPVAPAANAEQSALQMLADFSNPPVQPSATPVDSQAAFNGIGNWTAVVTSDTTVRLDIRADGSFTWTANSKGKQSSFQGTYTLGNQQLTLIRESDKQKLDGSMTVNGNSEFIFRLTGAQDAGLKFVRS
jgi:uncharacterized protein (TIGR03066 family)